MVQKFGQLLLFIIDFFLFKLKRKKLHVFVEKVDTVEIKQLLSFVVIGIFMSGLGLHC
jgi:hypothetical protein